MKVVAIKWQDATTICEWSSIKEAEKGCFQTCYACGLLIANTKKIVTVALLLSEDKKTISNWINIPARDVLEFKVIGEIEWEDKDV
uniref:Uncharacterized protein n=1 Tax=viral metagenome TaxID=1070528 RepID=A0A6M3KWM5_9ZZZZ